MGTGEAGASFNSEDRQGSRHRGRAQWNCCADWAAERIKTSFEEEEWWTDPIQEGWVVDEDEIPPVVDGIETYYFDGCLTPEREEELLAGATPTEDEQVLHRERFLRDVFENAQNYDNWLTMWQIFEVRADASACYLLIANRSMGQGGLDITAVQLFEEAEDALNWLRRGAIIEQDFLRWRTKRADL